MTDARLLAGARSPRRRIFFAVTGTLIVLVIVAAREVILPFILALLIAYVLTPVVALAERRRIHRAAAVALVYVAILGSGAIFVRLVAPRVGVELVGLRRDVPKMANELRDVWIPTVSARLRLLGLLPPAQVAAVVPEAPAIVVRPQPDGSYAVDVGTGVELIPAHGGYVVRDVNEPKEGPFDLNRAFGDALGKTVSYVQHNTMELARIGRDVVTALSRAVFVFFITLMLAAYVMVTRENILGFARSLVRPSARADFSSLSPA